MLFTTQSLYYGEVYYFFTSFMVTQVMDGMYMITGK